MYRWFGLASMCFKIKGISKTISTVTYKELSQTLILDLLPYHDDDTNFAIAKLLNGASCTY